MPMIDAYAAAGTFADKHQLALDLATAVMTIEQVPDIPMFRQNTAAFVHDLDSVQGALIIALQREDVVLPGDLAFRKAVQVAYQLDHLPAQQEVLAIAEKWRPYRSLATSYLFSAALERTETPPAARRETWRGTRPDSQHEPPTSREGWRRPEHPDLGAAPGTARL